MTPVYELRTADSGGSGQVWPSRVGGELLVDYSQGVSEVVGAYTWNGFIRRGEKKKYPAILNGRECIFVTMRYNNQGVSEYVTDLSGEMIAG